MITDCRIMPEDLFATENMAVVLWCAWAPLPLMPGPDPDKPKVGLVLAVRPLAPRLLPERIGTQLLVLTFWVEHSTRSARKGAWPSWAAMAVHSLPLPAAAPSASAPEAGLVALEPAAPSWPVGVSRGVRPGELRQLSPHLLRPGCFALLPRPPRLLRAAEPAVYTKAGPLALPLPEAAAPPESASARRLVRPQAEAGAAVAEEEGSLVLP